MFTELGQKIEHYLGEHYPLFMNYNYGSDLYLCGGAIRDLMIGQEPKDIDLFLLHNRQAIFDFIKQNNLLYRQNSFGDPKILLSGKEIDFFSIDNFSDVVMYNVDGLFYNLTKHQFALQGFENMLECGAVVTVKKDNLHPSADRTAERRQKVYKFVSPIKKNSIFKSLKNDLENYKPNAGDKEGERSI